MKCSKYITAFTALLLVLFLASCACQGVKDPAVRRANATVLPATTGYAKGVIPTVNLYGYSPGCYIACYSHDRYDSVYSIGQGMYVKGRIRINGLYIGKICQPQGYFFKDISAMPKFKQLCSKLIAACSGNRCWAGGDTGGWVGIE